MGCGASSSAPPYVAPAGAGATVGRGGSAKLSSGELLSSVRAYVESPAFAAPLSNWIDENCVTFTEDYMDDISMEPAYRGYHSQYIAFTDALLTAHLMQFGVSLTKFYRKIPAKTLLRTRQPLLIRWRATLRRAGSCREHIGSPDVESPAIRAILSMVDFNCFQMMMVTRNAELEMEQGRGGGNEFDGNAESEEEAQLRRAIELSMAEAGGGDGSADADIETMDGRGRGRGGRGRGGRGGVPATLEISRHCFQVTLWLH